MDFLMWFFNGLLAIFTGLMAYFSYRLWRTSKKQGEILESQGEIILQQLQEQKSSDIASFYFNLEHWNFEFNQSRYTLFNHQKETKSLEKRVKSTYDDLITSLQEILPNDDSRIKTLIERREKLLIKYPHVKEPSE